MIKFKSFKMKTIFHQDEYKKNKIINNKKKPKNKMNSKMNS